MTRAGCLSASAATHVTRLKCSRTRASCTVITLFFSLRILSGEAMIQGQQSGLNLDGVVEDFFDSYLEQLQSLGPSGVVHHQAHDCATGAAQQQTNLKNLVAEANQYQDYMQTMEFDIGMSELLTHCSFAPLRRFSAPLLPPT